MKTYDFDQMVNRRGSNCVKWDEMPEGVLPLWVADMDFAVATPIVEALKKRVSHPVFGYSIVPAAYYDAVTSWFKRRHSVNGYSTPSAWCLPSPVV